MKTLLLLLCLWFLIIIWLSYRQQRKQRRVKSWAEKQIKRHSTKTEGALKSLRDANEGSAEHPEITRRCSLNSLPPIELETFTLIRANMLDEKTVAFAESLIAKLKRPHPALQAVTQNISTEELIDVLHGSPDITAKILTTVNSAAFNLAQPITSINHAVIYLGISIVKSIATQFIIKQSLDPNRMPQQNAFKVLWSQSYLNSSLSFMLAQSLSVMNAAELSTKALLANIGSFCLMFQDNALAKLYVEEHSLIKRIEYEQKHFGVNSIVLGSLLAKKWLLPNTVQEAITHHLFPLRYNPNNKAFSEEERHDLTFCYFVNRLGEAILYENLSDVKEYELDKRDDLETFYLQQALTDTGLDSALLLLQNRSFQEKAKSLIAQARDFGSR